MIKKPLIFLFVLFLLSCGKHTKNKDNVENNLNRYVDALLEGNFLAQEKTLGNSFCDALSYKKTNFVNLHASGSFIKKFDFDMSQKTCQNPNAASFAQILNYSGNGGISYVSGGAPGVIPFVETDTSGVYSTYCAARNQLPRTFSNGSEIKTYHFFPGTECGGDATQICAVYERAPLTDLITTNYKRILISNGSFLGRDLKGQELFSIEQATCGGSFQILHHVLRTVRD